MLEWVAKGGLLGSRELPSAPKFIPRSSCFLKVSEVCFYSGFVECLRNRESSPEDAVMALTSERSARRPLTTLSTRPCVCLVYFRTEVSRRKDSDLSKTNFPRSPTDHMAPHYGCSWVPFLTTYISAQKLMAQLTQEEVDVTVADARCSRGKLKALRMELTIGTEAQEVPAGPKVRIHHHSWAKHYDCWQNFLLASAASTPFSIQIKLNALWTVGNY